MRTVYAAILCLLWVLGSTDGSITKVCYNATDDSYTIDGYCDLPVAFADFQDNITTEGWSYLEVVTSPEYSDEIQSYAAGVAEAVATRQQMQNHFRNTVENYCNGSTPYCRRLLVFLTKNLEWMYGKIKENPEDPYWHQVNLLLLQVAGLEDGVAGMLTGPRKIAARGALFFQLTGDLLDLELVLGKRTFFKNNTFCSAFVKPTPDGQDLLISHVSWEDYKTMLRIQKLYNFGFKLTVAASKVTFSSYPGTVFSLDDFYLLSSGLVVTETTLNNYNSSSLKLVKQQSVLQWIRTVVANRLASNGPEWVAYNKKYLSGTYNNQFMIIDYNKFIPGKPLSHGLFTVMETMPNLVVSADATNVLRQQGYWPSYNRAYFKEIFDISGAPLLLNGSIGYWYSYDEAPRGKIFKRDWHTVTDMASLQKLMRYNNFQHDPLSICPVCIPSPNAEHAISSRLDLNSPSGTYPINDWKHAAWGGIDFKATNYDFFRRNLQFAAINGPTYDQQAPFSWSKSGFGKTVPHFGQPDEFRFPTVLHKWRNIN